MELRHLRYFIAVAEEENITRAAARLHVTQPSLSRQIRDLEGRLDVPLFDHAHRTVRLTDAGRHFLEEAKSAVRQVERAVKSVRQFAHGNWRELHLGYSTSLTTAILPTALRWFRESCPSTRVKLHDLSTEKMLGGLRDQSLDVALLVEPSPAALDGLEFREIMRCHPWVFMPPSHPLRTLSEVDVRALDREPLVALDHADYPEYHVWLGKIFKGAILPPVHSGYDTPGSLIAAIESGCGIGIMQEGFACFSGARLESRRLRTLSDASFAVGIAHRTGSTQTVEEFVAATLAATNGQAPPAAGNALG